MNEWAKWLAFLLFILWRERKMIFIFHLYLQHEITTRTHHAVMHYDGWRWTRKPNKMMFFFRILSAIACKILQSEKWFGFIVFLFLWFCFSEYTFRMDFYRLSMYRTQLSHGPCDNSLLQSLLLISEMNGCMHIH